MLTCLYRNTDNTLNGFHVSWSWSFVSVHSLVLVSVATAKHRDIGIFPVKERLNFLLKVCSCC